MPRTDAPALLRAAANLRVDALTAEVVSALAAAGVRAILLKGPALARFLYDGSPARTYGDTDLLVAPADVDAAETVLARLGFRRFLDDVEIRGDERVAALAWLRAADRATVDLHGGLPGVELEPEPAWEVLSAETASIRVASVDVETLAPAALVFHVALHAAQHGKSEPKPLADLERALERVGRHDWVAAARLAERLRATDAFAAGICLRPAGALLAEALDLPRGRSVAVSLRAESAPTGAFAFERVVRARGRRAKARVLARVLAPSPAHMRAFDPIARHRIVGLPLAYAARPFALLSRAPAAALAWRRARRSSG